MDSQQVIEKFKARGALLEGHFLLTSGLHSSVYLQCAQVLQYPEDAAAFGTELARRFADRGIRLVAAPAIGGIVIGHEVARALGARFIWTERQAGNMTLRRGFSVLPNEPTLVIEDVITTGGSTIETIRTLRENGANIIGAGSIIDRSGGRATVGVERISLATLSVPAVDASECYACKLGQPLVKPGSRKNLAAN